MGVKNLKKKILDILCVWSSSTCERIRKDLNFKKSEGIYYDSTEIDETMKYITMLPKKMDVIKNYMKRFYGESITELNEAQANQKLVNTTPKNVLKSYIYHMDSITRKRKYVYY